VALRASSSDSPSSSAETSIGAAGAALTATKNPAFSRAFSGCGARIRT